MLSLSEARFQTHGYLLFISFPAVEKPQCDVPNRTGYPGAIQTEHMPVLHCVQNKTSSTHHPKTTLPWSGGPCCKRNSGIARAERSLGFGNDPMRHLPSQLRSNRDTKLSIVCCLLLGSHGTSLDHRLGATSRDSRLSWCLAMAS